MDPEDLIAGMLEGRAVFITGGTGFLGKLLIEKILRRCKGVKTVYLLIREKKGKRPEERVKDIFSNMLFDTLKNQDPSSLNKCISIPGDVSDPNLGISAHHRSLLQSEVEFIFHVAASTRFDDTVRTATRINTRGTKYALDLARECSKLKVFVHVSTAYAHPQEPVLEEKAYKPPADPLKIINAIDYDGKDETEDVYTDLLGDSPNTYTFAKALAEDLVMQEMGTLPAIVVRPSVVCPTAKDPIPGWCNNLQGPMGLFVGAGKGIIRTMHLVGDEKADFIPADLVINAILVSSWVHLNHDRDQRFYNATGSEYNRTWKEIIDTGRIIVTQKVPFNGIVWYPGGSPKKSKMLHNICFYLFQILPALLIDTLLFVLGYKPVLYQIQRRIQKGSEMLDFFINREWEFVNVKTAAMGRRLNKKEKEIYKLDGEGLEVEEYLTNCILCVRRNNLKETDDMLPAAKRNIKIMWVLDVVCKIGFVAIMLKMMYRWTVALLPKT